MLMHILLAEWFCCVPTAPYANNSSSWPSIILWSHYSSHIYMGFMPEDWLHHNICVPCAVQWNLMWPLNVEISCNDISFNPFSASPPHRTYARSARLILRKLLVLIKIVLLTTNMKKDF